MILVTRSAFSYPTVSKMVFHKLLLQIGFLGHFKGLQKKKKKTLRSHPTCNSLFPSLTTLV